MGAHVWTRALKATAQQSLQATWQVRGQGRVPKVKHTAAQLCIRFAVDTACLTDVSQETRKMPPHVARLQLGQSERLPSTGTVQCTRTRINLFLGAFSLGKNWTIDMVLQTSQWALFGTPVRRTACNA